MARAIARRGHRVEILTTDRDAESDEGLAAGTVREESGVTLRVFAQGQPRAFATSWPLMRALGPAVGRADVVHLHSLHLFHVWATARACRRQGKPYLLRPHGTLDPFIRARRPLEKRLLGMLFQDRVIREAAALHWTAAEEATLAAPATFGTRGVVVPNGLDLAEYATLPPAGTFRASRPEIGDRRIVLFLSRLNFKKGLDLLIPAFARVAGRRDDVHLVIAGPDDGMAAPARGWIEAHGIRERVSFVGQLAGAAKLAAFRDAACFALPSYSENFGIAVVEAMACGLPVLVSDKVNIWREIAEAGGGEVATTTVEDVAAKLDALLADPARARAMGEAGRALATRNYDWSKIAERLEAVYRALADGTALPE
ncbi:MAG: glycosyltransferase [Alphaproteobacteria bacterium]|nr:glycosyltransferase [Alphaproteobacteria bacterium]